MIANENTTAGDPTSNLVWIDLEMTGLDPDTCFIIEIASLVTNADLEVLGALGLRLVCDFLSP